MYCKQGKCSKALPTFYTFADGASEALSVKFQRFKFQAIVTIVAYFAIVIRINVRNNTPAIQRLR
jgi:hypothetical protein